MIKNFRIPSKEFEEYMTAPENLSVVEKAKFYITRCTPGIGAFTFTGPANRFIRKCVAIIEGPAKDSALSLGRSERNSAEALAM
jgi:hypothetical protein